MIPAAPNLMIAREAAAPTRAAPERLGDDRLVG
jgi:hypothetical protein